MRKAAKSQPEAVWQTHVYLPESLRKKLNIIADREHRSVTQQIAFYLRKAIEDAP